MDDKEYYYLKRKVMALTGIDLDCYKSQQMRRRLEGFIASNSPGVVQYCEKIAGDREALKRLLDFLTINVSEFFRDQEHFDLLKDRILPELLSRSPTLNIWSAGCSHGGEAYSLAIILDEISPGRNHRVLATDIDDGVLARAREGGAYAPADVRNVGKTRLMKYFTESPGGFKVKDVLRNRVMFKRFNLLGERFESGFDLIVCRNVIIYFTDKAKATLMEGFRKSLKDRGVLFLGATETMVIGQNSGFDRLGVCFYQKQAVGMPELASAGAPVRR